MISNYSRLVLALLVCGPLFAKSGGVIDRGGIGFLFSDNNNFSNPGLFGKSRAFAVDAKYETSQGGARKGVSTSAVYGSGAVGIGAFGQRSGTNLSASDSYSDTAGAGIGFALAKGRVLVGAGYQRGVGTRQTDDGRADATLSVRSDKGFSFAAGATSQLNSVADEKRTATVAVGYSYSSGVTFELDATANDLSNTRNLTGAAYVSKSASRGYASVGYVWSHAVSQHGAAARLGMILGKAMDFSVYATHTFVTGASPAYGGALRLTL